MEIIKVSALKHLVFVFEGLDEKGRDAATKLTQLTQDRKWLDDQNPELMVLGNGTEAYPQDYEAAEVLVGELVEEHGLGVEVYASHVITDGKRHTFLIRVYEEGAEGEEESGEENWD